MVLEACEQGEVIWHSKVKVFELKGGEKKAFVLFPYISPLSLLNMASDM